MRRTVASAHVAENTGVIAGSSRIEARIASNRPAARGEINSSNTAVTYEPLLNDTEAARFLGGLHPKTVQRMARRGELPHYRVGKYYRYRASELSQWLMVHSSSQNNPSALTPKEMQ